MATLAGTKSWLKSANFFGRLDAKKGRWTYRLIGNLQSWVERRYGHVDFYIIHFLTGHGCFREYLCKHGHGNVVNCFFCDNGNESADHIFIYCLSFRLERVLSIEVWHYAKMLSANVMQELRRIERTRRTGIMKINSSSPVMKYLTVVP